MQEDALYLPLGGALIAVISLVLAFRAGRRRRLIEGLPTSKTSGVFIGLVELKGTAQSAEPLTSYLAGRACVQYQWSVEEHWSRTVIETYSDEKGNTHTRTRTESGWTQLAAGGELIPFYLQDDCGYILVRPEGAKIESEVILSETCTPLDPIYYGKGPAGAVADTTFTRRFVESAIPVQVPLFIVGQAREREDIVAPEIAADKNAPFFLISTRSQEQVSSGMKWGARGWIALGLAASVGGMVMWDNVMKVDPESRLLVYLLIAAGYLFLGLLAWVMMIFNSLVDLRNRVRQAWSLVDVQLQRRFDLIPNLVNCVKGYRDHEAQLQTELAALRDQLAATAPGVAGPDPGAISGTVIAITERYPELKADQAFLALQQTLSETEQRIALARSYFNEIATHFNTRIETVPEKFVAALGTMKPQPLMEANDFERAAVTVEMTPAATTTDSQAG